MCSPFNKASLCSWSERWSTTNLQNINDPRTCGLLAHHASLADLTSKTLLFFSYKDTSHTFTRCIIVDTKLLSWSIKANTQVLLWSLRLLQTLDWSLLIQINLKAFPVDLSTSCWSWIDLSWTSNQNSLKLWVLSYILEYHHAFAAHSDFHCANSNVWYFILPIPQLGYPP